MTLLALDEPSLRQTLVSGRLTDAVSGAGLEGFEAVLDYAPVTADPAFHRFPARFRRSAGGYYCFHLDPARDLPALTGLVQVTLRVTFASPGRADVAASRVVDVADLAPAPASVTIGGHDAEVIAVAAAPFEISASVAPAPVAVAGHVFRDHDPDTPAVGAAISIIEPVSTQSAVADALGRFRIDTLPVAASVTLEVDDGGNTAQAVIRPDYSIPVNETVLSVSTA